jgi:putative nucleotidyltransferase with HDIG domain
MSAATCARNRIDGAPPPRAESDLHVGLLRLFASPSYKPPLLPTVAVEILALSQRPHVSFSEVTSVLERDPVLAAKVLALAQSALYRARVPILSLQQATVRLGLATLRDIVLEVAVSLRVFRVPGYAPAMARLSWHSKVTAHLMRALCARTSVEAGYAFLCGLLHDIGFAAGLLALSDDSRGRGLPFEEIGRVVDELHQEAAGVVTRLWGLPPEIQRVVATHHQLVVGGTPHPVNATLIVAERFAAELGAAVSPEGATAAAGLDGAPPGLFEAACETLGLAGASLDAARCEATEIAAALRDEPALRDPADDPPR